MKDAHYIYLGRGGEPAKPKEFAMTQIYENNMQNIELQRKKIIMMGGSVKREQQKLPKETIEEMKKNYTKMYFAFTSINWASGKTLGMSWQKALEQMDSYVATKTKMQNHPIGTELMKIHNSFRREMAKSIMTSQHANEKLQEPHIIQSFMNYGTKSLKNGKYVLDNMYQKYTPKTNIKNPEILHKFGISSQMLMNQLVSQMINERAA